MADEQSYVDVSHGKNAWGWTSVDDSLFPKASYRPSKTKRLAELGASVLASLADTGYAALAAGSAVVVGASQAASVCDLNPLSQLVQGLQDFGTMAQPYFDYLPVAGLVGAGLDFFNASVDLYRTPHSDFTRAKSAIKIIGSITQGYTGYNFLTSAMIIGSPALGYMALGMAVNAGAKLVAAIIDLYQLHERRKQFELRDNLYLGLEYLAAQRKVATNLLAFIGWGLIGTVTIAAAASPAAPALLMAGAVCLAAMALVATANLVIAAYCNQRKHGNHPFFAVPNSCDKAIEENHNKSVGRLFRTDSF